MLSDMLQQAKELPAVSPSAAQEYGEKRTVLVDFVNSVMENSADFSALLGPNPPQVMHDNHASHALFMANVLQLSLYETLVRVVLWAYRGYHARGFSYAYFPLELGAWIEAVQDKLQKEHAREIVTVYNWLLERHEQFITLAPEKDKPEAAKDPHLEKIKSLFQNCLLEGDSRTCLQLANDYVGNRQDVQDFYLQIIQPAMYGIGCGWEMGEVSVAQEHLASAIVARVMSSLYQSHVLGEDRPQRRAVVSAAPNEFHETGAHMIADFLEMNGWDVYYLGANTPLEDLKKLLLEKKPFLLAISVTMPFNLLGVKEIVEMVRENETMQHVKIMAGGISFNLEPLLWKQLGADGWAVDARDAVGMAQTWYEEARSERVE